MTTQDPKSTFIDQLPPTLTLNTSKPVFVTVRVLLSVVVQREGAYTKYVNSASAALKWCISTVMLMR